MWFDAVYRAKLGSRVRLGVVGFVVVRCSVRHGASPRSCWFHERASLIEGRKKCPGSNVDGGQAVCGMCGVGVLVGALK